MIKLISFILTLLFANCAKSNSSTKFTNFAESTSDSCVENFLSQFPQYYSDYVIDYPYQEYSYVLSTIISTSAFIENLNTWCIDYNLVIYPGINYNESVAIDYIDALKSNTTYQNLLARPSRLNQLAYLVNHIFVGDVAKGPQTLNGQSVPNNCSILSVSDIQAAIWALSQSEGECDNPSSLCTDSLGSVNVCNVAYVYNEVLEAVPDGTAYIVQDTTCTGIIPVLIFPTGLNLHVNRAQVMLVASSFSSWDYNCPCPTFEPTYNPTAHSSLFETIAPSFKPTIFPTLSPVKKGVVVPTKSPGSGFVIDNSDYPTSIPTELPTDSLISSATPSAIPTNVPIYIPTNNPTNLNTVPSLFPNYQPSLIPTVEPSFVPSDGPTLRPLSTATLIPTNEPTLLPSSAQTSKLIDYPSNEPSNVPTSVPSTLSTDLPRISPTFSPSLSGFSTFSPSELPTNNPSYLLTEIPVHSPTPSPTFSSLVFPTLKPTVIDSCVDNFITSLPFNPTYFEVSLSLTSSYVISTIQYSGRPQISGLLSWCVDKDQDASGGYDYSSSLTYPYTYVIQYPSVAAGIDRPNNLNQVAWIINNLPVGTLASGPQIWQTSTSNTPVTYAGCTYISASDIQSAIWAFVQTAGECDYTTICTTTLSDVNNCNVAFIWNTAVAAVSIGTTYTIPDASPSFPNPIVPFVVVPDGTTQETQVFVVEGVVTNTLWGLNCVYSFASPTSSPNSLSSPPTIVPTSLKPSFTPTMLTTTYPTIDPITLPTQPPTTTPTMFPTLSPTTSNVVSCVNNFITSLPFNPTYFEVSLSLTSSYVISTIQYSGRPQISGLLSWCVDKDQDASGGYDYSSSLTYPYTYVIQYPSVAAGIDRPNNLNQVAWIINNLPVGTLASGLQIWQTSTSNTPVTYAGCTYISASDIQSAIWAFVQTAGECDYTTICTTTLSDVNNCNVAFIWNTAVAAVSIGTTYTIPDASPSFPNPIVPFVVVPDGTTQETQVILVEAVITFQSWELNCNYPTVVPTNSPLVVPTLIPSSSLSYVPTVLPSSSPTQSPSILPSLLSTVSPTLKPSISPTRPTYLPTKLPISSPSAVPTASPTFKPTSAPSSYPTLLPSVSPTVLPSKCPTTSPTISPTLLPSVFPTKVPTLIPTSFPTKVPSSLPSSSPSFIPSTFPTNSPTVTDSCVQDFISNLPINPSSFVLASSLTSSYVSASITYSGTTYTSLLTWCVDKDQDANVGFDYASSTSYPYTYVIENPTVASGIRRPSHLNQIAWIMNNLPVGSVATGSQIWQTNSTYTSTTYSGCTTITASDIQAAIWAFVQQAGECDYKSFCTNSLSNVNHCNVAYIWNAAVEAVPLGKSYFVPDASSFFPNPVVPFIVVPDGTTQSKQVMLVEADIVSWGYNYCTYPTYSPTFSPSSLPTFIPSFLPTKLPTTIPTTSPTKTPTIKPTAKPKMSNLSK